MLVLICWRVSRIFESPKAGRAIGVGAGVEGFVLFCSYAFWKVIAITWNIVRSNVILSAFEASCISYS